MALKNKIIPVTNQYNTLKVLFSKSKNELVICSPFINHEGINFLISTIASRKINFTLFTDLNPQHILSGFLHLDSLLKIFKHYSNFKLYHSSKLHAKIYMNDVPSAFITSANLTGGGILSNFEYGIYCEDSSLLFKISNDVQNLMRTSKSVDESSIKKINQNKIKITEKLNLSDPAITDFINLVAESTGKFDLENAENAEKIKFIILDILEKYGPMRTIDIHEKIEENHPELCGTQDRIINGKKFGKLWKHQVRNAQHSLKKSKMIAFDGKFWKIK